MVFIKWFILWKQKPKAAVNCNIQCLVSASYLKVKTQSMVSEANLQALVKQTQLLQPSREALILLPCLFKITS